MWTIILGLCENKLTTCTNRNLIDGCSVEFCAMSETKWIIYMLIIKK